MSDGDRGHDGGRGAEGAAAERGPISWDALAAELAATREEAGDADPRVWDAVATELAARVAERPAAVDEVPPLLPQPATLTPEPAVSTPQAVVAAPAPAPPPVEELDRAALRGGLEALLFVLDDPVDEPTLAAALRCPAEQVRSGLAELAAEYDRRGAGIKLRRVGERWRLYTREEYAEVVERHLSDAARTRLSSAALETLAVIAYRQPVTRARISAIRGVGVDGVMRTLVARGLVREVGSDPDSGGGLYGTTPLFLEQLGLQGLDELPELAPLLPEPSAVPDEPPRP